MTAHSYDVSEDELTDGWMIISMIMIFSVKLYETGFDAQCTVHRTLCTTCLRPHARAGLEQFDETYWLPVWLPVKRLAYWSTCGLSIYIYSGLLNWLIIEYSWPRVDRSSKNVPAPSPSLILPIIDRFSHFRNAMVTWGEGVASDVSQRSHAHAAFSASACSGYTVPPGHDMILC